MENLLSSPPKPSRTVHLVQGCIPVYMPPRPLNAQTVAVQERPLKSSGTCIQSSVKKSPVSLNNAKQTSLHTSHLLRYSPAAYLPNQDINDTGSTSSVEQSSPTGGSSSSLHQVVSEVITVQRAHSEDIRKHQHILAELQEKLTKAREKVHGLTLELNSLKRKQCVAADDFVQKAGNCRQLEGEIEDAIAEKQDLTASIIDAQTKLGKETSLLKEYTGKMKEFESKVDVLESKYGYRKELEELKKNVQELENQKLTLEKNPDKARHLREGKCESDLKQELQKLDDEKRQLRGQLLDKEKQVKALNLQQEKTKQETQVLRKRNAAQMTRLKRQLKEVTSRNRQWNEQASQLEKGIAELKKKLQDDH